MRLKLKQVNKNKTVKKVSNDVKKVSTRKKFKESLDYMDTTFVNVKNVLKSLSDLTYGDIMSCEVSYVIVDQAKIELKNSWSELILVMIDTVRVNHEDDFLDYVTVNGITDSFTCIGKTFGKYSFDDTFHAYKLYDSDYYVEALFDTANIYRLLTTLAKCCKIEFKQMSLMLINNNVESLSAEEKVVFNSSDIVNIIDYRDAYKTGTFLNGVIINGRLTTLHRAEALLVLFCTFLNKRYTDKIFEKLDHEMDTCVVSKSDVNDDGLYQQIGDSDWYIKSNLNMSSALEFICDACNKLKLTSGQVEVCFKKLVDKDTVKEWEVE